MLAAKGSARKPLGTISWSGVSKARKSLDNANVRTSMEKTGQGNQIEIKTSQNKTRFQTGQDKL